MSEFSEGYFIKSNHQDEAVQILKRAGLRGYVYPDRDGWVAFVADTQPLFEFPEKLKAANHGILLKFVNVEDHGWGFEIYVKQEMVCSFSCGFNDEIEMCQISREIDKDRFQRLLNEENRGFEILGKYFDESTKQEDIINANDFKEDMGLYYSDWISYQYADMENGEIGTYGDVENLKLKKVD